jgi:hypothetical protein
MSIILRGIESRRTFSNVLVMLGNRQAENVAHVIRDFCRALQMTDSRTADVIFRELFQNGTRPQFNRKLSSDAGNGRETET